MILFMFLVPLRSKEVRAARWEEFNGRDWTVPAERVKGRHDFSLRVPPQALELVKRLHMRKQLEKHGSIDLNEWMATGYVFPYTTTGSPPSGRTVARWKDRLGPNNMDLHGLRSTFLSWCGDYGHDTTLGERCLGHLVDGKVTQAYLRTDFANARAEVLEVWADYLSGRADVEFGQLED